MERYEQLRNRVEELQEAMQGYPDALDSPYWDEYERALYALAEMDLAISAEVEGRYALADMAEMAERASLVELEQLGFIAFEEATSDAEWDALGEDTGEALAFWEIAQQEYVPCELL